MRSGRLRLRLAVPPGIGGIGTTAEKTCMKTAA
jgi:hypothetical protein